MRYYLIAGEASGDLHASCLIQALRRRDPQAEFRGIGGGLMEEAGAGLLMHYKSLAYMGFIPVLLHAGTILKGMRRCKRDILAWCPDVVILVDYPGFNLSVARFVHTHSRIPVYYYISPKIWAWKEHRIKSIRRYVDSMFCILPFEVGFYRKRGYKVDYVGNPSADEVHAFLAHDDTPRTQFLEKHHLDARPVIALLAGSRKQELNDNLSRMVEAVGAFPDCQPVIAGAPGLVEADYAPYIKGTQIPVVFGATYALLKHSRAALVTSGTATLETALLGVPQVVCYYTACGKLVSLLRKWLLKVPYISLVNLIAEKEVVPELVADGMTIANVRKSLRPLLEDSPRLQAMLEGYATVRQRLGEKEAPEETARSIIQKLTENDKETGMPAM